MPTVSVVVPLYDKEHQITRCLDSVLAQTEADFEVVVVDDGSRDAGAEKVAAYADERIRLLRQPNAGPGAARNRAMRESRGTWIAPLDADDAWEPDCLETLLGHARDHPDCEVVVCAWYSDPADREHMQRRFRAAQMPTGPYRLEPGLGAVAMRQRLARFGSRNTLMRRDVALRLGGFYEGRRQGEDLYLWVQLLLHCRIYLGDEVLAFQDNEASALWAGPRREGRLPLPRPLVADPEPIRRACPAAYREQLDALIVAMTRREAWQQLRAGRPEAARELLDDCPLALHGAVDRARFRLWERLAAGQRDRFAGRWTGLAGLLYRRAHFLRPAVMRTWERG